VVTRPVALGQSHSVWVRELSQWPRKGIFTCHGIIDIRVSFSFPSCAVYDKLSRRDVTLRGGRWRYVAA
jgi:hypothetical protein